MDVNVQIALAWTLLAIAFGAAPAAVIGYVVGKRAGVRAYHAERTAKSAATRKRKREQRVPRIFADALARDMGEGEE